MGRRKLFASMLAIAILAGCSSGGGATGNDTQVLPKPAPSSNYIKHVVIIVQENRSFDDVFEGFPGANTATSGTMSNGTVVQLTSRPLNTLEDIDHHHSTFEAAYDGGKMDGFDKEGYSPAGNPGGYNELAGTVPYHYIARSDVQPYWDLAQQYTLADDMFSTQSSGSYTAHQELIAGTTPAVSPGRIVDFPTNLPWGCDAPSGTTTSIIATDGSVTTNGPFPCYDYPTIANLLDAKGVTWKYYAPMVDTGPTFPNLGGDVWSAFDSVKPVRYGSEWNTNISSPETNIFTDISSGKLAQVSYVIPSMPNSDHDSSGSNTGPSWVSSIVNAVGQSPYWNDTAIVILWDEWGGWYDNVKPPQLSYDGLGFRVPMIVVSAYAKHGYVSHTQYEFGSVLKFVENTFGLGSLNTTDVRANSIVDCFDFTQSPSAFKQIQTRYSRRALLAMPRSYEPPDNE
ncbi:MAG TPA: alkaline phosphatase family protein [Candidatus Baltobacteraceae bacterium]|nr:alkaline phosphatase family protein [Candidatus Baltobacteraceae bacterium]